MVREGNNKSLRTYIPLITSLVPKVWLVEYVWIIEYSAKAKFGRIEEAREFQCKILEPRQETSV